MMGLYLMLRRLLMGMKDLQSKINVAISHFSSSTTAAIAGSAGTKNSSTRLARLFSPQSYKSTATGVQ